MTKHVHWLLDIEPGSIDAIINSHMASQRLRAGCMIRYTQAKLDIVTAGRSALKEAEILIVGKIGANNINALAENWLHQIAAHKSAGKKVFLDFTDNYLEFPAQITPFYSYALNMVDGVICSSDVLAASVSQHFQGTIECIPDPIEITPLPPKSAPFWPRTLLWFGHSSNLPYLVNFFHRLQANVPIRLLILSDVDGLQALERARVPIPKNLKIELRKWTTEATIRAASESDCCIIPSNSQDKRKSGVSSNRLLTGLALGLPTIASQLASYLPFSEYFTNIDSADSTNVLIDPCAYAHNVSIAQQVVLPQYSMQAIGKKWFNFIDRH